MKSVITRRINLMQAICFTLLSVVPMFANAQNKREIKDFYQSFTFTNTYTIDLKANTHSENISGITFVVKFNIDKNGEGTIDSETKGFKSTTLVTVDYSQIRTFNQMIHWNFGCIHSERPEKIQMTIEINPESNKVESLVIYNEEKEKAFVFY